ncbi:AMP-binding protein [Terrarubrum flagellatum]|uniref:AMP-binding protein n=1 Tax=Terrirubrum flagellatum TaxID=2895980 RepID=UPI003145496B
MESANRKLFAPAAVTCEPHAGGGWSLRSPISLPDGLDSIPDRLAMWARKAPDCTLVAERAGQGWRRLTYADAWSRSAGIAARLARRGSSPERPIMIVGGASIAHFLLRLGAMRAGVPFAPISPALLRYGAIDRLGGMIGRLNPGLIALSEDCSCLWPEKLAQGVDIISLDDIEAGDAPNLPRLSEERPAIADLDSVAAIFFTSGSTDEPKGVVMTHRNLSANQAAYQLLWPFLGAHPPVILDWLPWHHTFGGNDNIHKAIWNGGSYYIDDGLPTPDGIARTIENVSLTAPTIHINVPKGLDLLVSRLESDIDFFRDFFQRLDAVFFAGAAMSSELWARLNKIIGRAREETGRDIALVSGYGATESGSTICLVHFPIDRPTALGLPLPGFSLRLHPVEDKLEVRIKGPSVTPAYWNDLERSVAAFDDEGYYRTGDAARLLDDDAPERGLLFDGRIAEDFKLANGAWVSVGPLRAALMTALAPFARDVLIAGADRDRLGLIVFVDVEACRSALQDNDAQNGPDSAMLRHAIAERLRGHNAQNPASTRSIARVALDFDGPSAERGEVNDKGYVNQRQALRNRSSTVAHLFSDPPSAAILIVENNA